MNYIKRIVFAVVMGMAGLNGYTQGVEVGVVGCGAGYIGDLNPNNLFKVSGINAGAFVKLNLDPYWNIGFHYNYGRVQADDADSENAQFRERNLRFFSPINELSFQGEFNFFNFSSDGRGRNFTPYVFAGLGGFFFSPRIKLNDHTFELVYRKTEGQPGAYRQYGIAVPYGVGAKIRLQGNWTLFSQIGYRQTFTDYIDDVSGYYPENQSIDGSGYNFSDPSFTRIGVKHTMRGDFRKRDTYMFVGIGISFTFVSQKCYTF